MREKALFGIERAGSRFDEFYERRIR